MDEERAVALVSDLTRELRLRMNDWAKSAAESKAGDLHRIALLERPSGAGLVSTLVMHLPGFAAYRARDWIFSKFLPSEAGISARWDTSWLEVTHIDDARGAQARHWHLMRKLWRGIDPGLVADGCLLAERLKLPRGDLRPSGRLARRRYSVSHGIGPSAQKRETEELAAHFSAYADGAWDHLFGFWELKEYSERRRVRARLEERARSWAIERSLTGDPMSARKLALEIELSANLARKPEEFRQKPWA